MNLGSNRVVTFGLLLAVTAALVTAGLIYDSSRTSSHPDTDSIYTPTSAEPSPENRVSAKPGPGGVLNMWVLGDRISLAEGALTPQEGYVEELAQQYASNGIQTSRVIEPMIGPIPVGYTAPPTPPESNLAILQVGTADAGSSTTRPTNKEEFTQNYTTLVQSIQASIPTAALICLGTWYNKSYTNFLNTTMKSICEQAGGQFINLNDLYDKGSTRGPIARETFSGPGDSYFPNNEGHKAIAQRIIDTVNVAR
jgi:acyl-CoA thioesterase-1